MARPSSLYLIGSLRNPAVPALGRTLRGLGIDVFDDWYAAGERADDAWRDYEVARGRDLPDALRGRAARHVFEFDLMHLNRCEAGLLVAPAGKSGHLELGYMIGQGKPGYVLLDGDPERYDVMYGFAKAVFRDTAELLRFMEGN